MMQTCNFYWAGNQAKMFPVEWSIRCLLRERQTLVQELVRIAKKREEDKCQSPHLCCVNAVAFSNSGVFLYTVCCKLLRRFVSLIKKVQQEISWQ